MFQAKLPARKFKGYVCEVTRAMQVGAAKEGEVFEMENASDAGTTGKSAMMGKSEKV